MAETRFYPLIVQTWISGRGSSLLSGSFHDASILKWAKEEILKWNEPRCPQEGEIISKYVMLGDGYYIIGLIRCGGIEDHGRAFTEIRGILLDKFAIISDIPTVQSLLLQHILDIEKMDCWQMSFPVRSPENPPAIPPTLDMTVVQNSVRDLKEKVCTFSSHILVPTVQKGCKTGKKTLGEWKDSMTDTWKNRANIWTKTQELCKNPKSIWPEVKEYVKYIILQKWKAFLWKLACIVSIILFVAWIWPSSVETPPTIPPPADIHSSIDPLQNIEQLRNSDQYTWEEFLQKCDVMKKRIDEHTRVRECRMFLQGEVATSGLWKEILPPENPSITIPTNWEICVMQERFQYLLYIKAPVSELVKLPPIQLEYSAKKIVLSVDFSTGIVEMKDDIQKSILKIFQVSVELP